MNTKELDNQYVAHAYGRFDVALTKGQGSTLYDEDGKKYIDFGSGIGVTAFGINDPVWTKAVEEQLHRVQHTSNLYYTAPCAKLAQLLCEKSGMKKVFFGNSGAEANEVFDPFTPGFKYCPANDIEALQAAATDDVCAVLFECVQGEGGVNNLSPTFVNAIAKLAKEKDILIAVDEVQTGNGRTGTYFAYQQYGITPDIVTTAKGLGGGLPIGAVLFGEKLQDTMTPGSHGSTFGGNPVVAAGACSIVERIDDDFLSEVQRKSEKIRTALAKVKGVKSISGMGLMLGIETDKPAGEVAKACLANGLLILTAKTKLRLLPALNISDAELDEGLEILKGVLEA